jgi:hypothetical protein
MNLTDFNGKQDDLILEKSASNVCFIQSLRNAILDKIASDARLFNALSSLMIFLPRGDLL